LNGPHANETGWSNKRRRERKDERSNGLKLKRKEIKKGEIKKQGKEEKQTTQLSSFATDNTPGCHIHKGDLRKTVIRGEVM
jgi:hypothetical protein